MPKPPQQQPPPPIAPRPIVFIFAAIFALAMLFNLVFDAYSAAYHGERITLFLGTATLLILGVDVGKMIGRR